MRLRTVGRYANTARGLVFDVGQEFDAPPDLFAFLMADAPGCFEDADPEPDPVEDAESVAFEPVHSAIDEAPANRAVGRPRKRTTPSDDSE